MSIEHGATGCLVHPARIVGGYPYSKIVWGTRTDSNGSSIWLSQSNKAGESAVQLYHGDSNDSKVAASRDSSGNDCTVVTNNAPHASNTTMQLMVGVWESTTVCRLYFGNNTAVTGSGSQADTLNTHDTTIIGGSQRYAAANPSGFAKGSLAEAHWFNVALTTANVTALLAGTVKPEELAGWVDGLEMLAYEPDGVYTSMTGTRTFTAYGTLAASDKIHPVSRVAAATASIAWTEGADVIAAAVNVTISGVAIAASWTDGADVISIAGTHSTAVGTITTEPMVNNADEVLANETGVIANVYNATTGALVVQKTGLTSNPSGVVTISDVLIVAGTSYAYEIVLTSNGRRLPVALAA